MDGVSPPPPQPPSKLRGFVQRAGTRFVVQAPVTAPAPAPGNTTATGNTTAAATATAAERCENFYFVGANNYRLMVRPADWLLIVYRCTPPLAHVQPGEP